MPDPPREALAWAIDVWRPGATSIRVRDLHEGQGPWLVTVGSGDAADSAILRVASPMKPAAFLRAEAAALTLADRSGLSAPKLIAIDDEPGSGRTVSLQSLLPGKAIGSQDPRSGVYSFQPYDKGMFIAVGAYLAGRLEADVHRVDVGPSSVLPERTEPGAGAGLYADEKRRYAKNPTERGVAAEQLLAHARAVLADHSRPHGEDRLIHGDVWPGNVMVSGRTVTGLIDWWAAGVGHPGIDLGHARIDTALLYDLDAADDILAGWEHASGRSADFVPYWDVVAALETAPDMGDGTDSRDSLLVAALDQLG